MKYESPFSWRYGSDEMRTIFSEENKYRLWRKIWVELARAQHKAGLVAKEELEDLEKHQENLDIARIWEIEKDTSHDVVAAIKEFAEKAKIGGGKIHLGATSMDISDNAETIRMQEALNIIGNKLTVLIKSFGEKIEKYAEYVCMGYTHLQPAEPTTLGYRFAFYAQDLLMDLELLQFVKKNLKSKGLKGAVGTSASLNPQFNQNVMDELGLEDVEITSQTAPRKIEFWLGSLFASIGEWQEPFGKSQVGSSAMPFKKNPIKAEQICSLARLVVSLSRVLWDNASHMLLERTLDDSANRRVVIPEMFLAMDEMLTSATKIIDGLIINERKVHKNLETYWPFSATENIILEAVKKGADRQKMHEVLREISLKAWEGNSMEDLLESNPQILKYLQPAEIDKLLDAKNHIGNASKKALELAGRIKKI
ncbi:adenylosuccinate lyase [Candidatus Daviesbacteria bacterium]|nr:adenylosuccinate lyase [Candidatus Daviesbacteria bacterium]